MKVSYQTNISEKRNSGSVIVQQTMEIEVDYNDEDNTFAVEAVKLYQNGCYIAEISKLLDKCEGSPLASILESIDWGEVFYKQKEHCETPKIFLQNTFSKFQKSKL